MTLKKFFYAILLSTLTASVYADVVGNYKCSVFDPKKNSHYDENLTVAKTGDTYRLQYYPPDSSIPYELGTGILSGDAFAVISWDPTTTWSGPEVFAVKSDGSLEGTWATMGKTLLGTENCTKT